MAVTIFSKQSGLVASFPDPTLPATTTLKIQGWGGFSNFKSIITRVNVAAQGNFQFLHTLGGNVYVYVFGDRVGQLGISGLAFDSICDDGTGTIGIERVLDYYTQNRIANRQSPIKVTIGVRTTVAGYLVAVAGDVVDPRSKIYQFNLQFMMAPNSGASCTVSSTGSSGGSSGGSTGGTSGSGSTGTGTQPGGDTTTQDTGKGNTNYPVNSGTIRLDGSFAGSATNSVASTGYSDFGAGPNTSMVKAQVR